MEPTEYCKATFNEFVVKPKKDAKSFVWSSFGLLCNHDDGKVADYSNIYCIPCIKDHKLKRYKTTVSTTNLSHHLKDSHGILRGCVA